jgi:hypothetical protein
MQYNLSAICYLLTIAWERIYVERLKRVTQAANYLRERHPNPLEGLSTFTPNSMEPQAWLSHSDTSIYILSLRVNEKNTGHHLSILIICQRLFTRDWNKWLKHIRVNIQVWHMVSQFPIKDKYWMNSQIQWNKKINLHLTTRIRFTFSVFKFYSSIHFPILMSFYILLAVGTASRSSSIIKSLNSVSIATYSSLL